MTPSVALTAVADRVLPDAVLVERIAALADRAALHELDSRHGMTLYAIAYSVLFDPGAADSAGAAAVREGWGAAASVDRPRGTAPGCLRDHHRRAAHASRPAPRGYRPMATSN